MLILLHVKNAKPQYTFIFSLLVTKDKEIHSKSLLHYALNSKLAKQ